MAMTLDEIVEQTRHLPADVVGDLVDRILDARHGGIDPKLEESWDKEIQRRLADFREGREKGVSLEEGLAIVRASVKA